MTLATTPVARPWSPGLSASPLAQMHVENLVLAVSSALTACSALQHVAMELDAALVQGAIALNGWLPREQEELSEAGSTVHVAKVLGAHLAALQAEGGDLSWCMSQLMCAQAEFAKEVHQWAHAVLPDVVFAAVEQATQDVLATSPEGALRKLCERHGHAALRGGADPTTPVPLLPPPRHGLERLCQVEPRPTSPGLQEEQAAALVLGKLQVSRSPTPLEQNRTDAHPRVALPHMVRRPGTKTSQLQAFTATKRHLVISDSDLAPMETLQPVRPDSQQKSIVTLEFAKPSETLHESQGRKQSQLDGRSDQTVKDTPTHASLTAAEQANIDRPESKNAFWETRFNEAVQELRLTKQALVDVKGELTIIRARKTRAGAATADTHGKNVRKPKADRKSPGASKEPGLAGISESKANASPTSPRHASLSGNSRSARSVSERRRSSGPAPLVFAKLNTQTEEDHAETSEGTDGGQAGPAPEKKKNVKMVFADGTFDIAKQAKDKLKKVEGKHLLEIQRLEERHQRHEDRWKAQMNDAREAYSKLQEEHEVLMRDADGLRQSLAKKTVDCQHCEAELEVAKIQVESLEEELANLKEVSKEQIALHEDVVAALEHANATGKKPEPLLQDIILRHYGSADEKDGMTYLRKKACHHWSLVRVYVGQLMRVSDGLALDPHSREVAVGLTRLCRRFHDQMKDHPMGIHEFIARYVLIEETNATMRGLVTMCRQDRQIQAKIGRFDDLILTMTETYNQAFRDAGGRADVSNFLEESQQVLRNFRRVRGGVRTRQDVGFEIIGLDALYDICVKRANAKLHQEVSLIAIRTGGEAVLSDMKDRQRARYKILTKYGSDTSCLTDVIRAAVVYKTIQDLYTAMFSIISTDLEVNRRDFFLVEVEDRFRNPLDSYRDIRMLFNIDGTVGELQLHVEHIFKAKHGEGHTVYQVLRQVNENMFGACVQNNFNNLYWLVKEYKVCAGRVCDKNGRNVLHYCCQLGSDKSVRLLLDYNADPWAADNSGVVPCELALRNEHFQVVELLLSHMKENPPMTRQATVDHPVHNSQPTADFGRAPTEVKATDFQPALVRFAKEVVPWWCDHSSFGSRSMEAEARSRWLEVGKLVLDFLRQYSAIKLVQDWMCLMASQGECQRLRTLIDAGFDPTPYPGQPSVMDLAILGGHKEVTSFLQLRDTMTDGGLECAQCVVENAHGHLRSATRREDSGQALAALSAKADPNHYQASIPPGKRTPLMSFAAAGDLPMVRELLSASAMVLALDRFQCNAVHYARAQGHEEVERLLESTKLLSERPLRGENLSEYLVEAVQSGCCGAVWRIQDPNLGDKVPDRETVIQLLKQPIGPFGYSSLHRAAEAARDDIDPVGQVCRALLRAQADPLVQTTKGDTALHLAAGVGSQVLFDMMEKEVEERLGKEAAREVIQTQKNEFGQAPGECLERTLSSRVRDQEKDALRDQKILLLAGFMGFKHCGMIHRINKMRENQALGLRDLLHNRIKELKKSNLEAYKHDSDSDTEPRAKPSPKESKTRSSASPSSSTSGEQARNMAQKHFRSALKPSSPQSRGSAQPRESRMQLRPLPARKEE